MDDIDLKVLVHSLESFLEIEMKWNDALHETTEEWNPRGRLKEIYKNGYKLARLKLTALTLCLIITERLFSCSSSSTLGVVHYALLGLVFLAGWCCLSSSTAIKPPLALHSTQLSLPTNVAAKTSSCRSVFPRVYLIPVWLFVFPVICVCLSHLAPHKSAFKPPASTLVRPSDPSSLHFLDKIQFELFLLSGSNKLTKHNTFNISNYQLPVIQYHSPLRLRGSRSRDLLRTNE